MTLHEMARRVGDIEGLDRAAGPLARAAKQLVPPGALKDALSGSHLGHPLHPALTDVPIGAYVGATVLDVFGGSRSQDAVDALIALGIVATVPTAAAGLADWSDTYGSEQRIGLVHALSNVTAVSLFAGSLVARRTGRRGLGRMLSGAGLAVLATGGYLGGHLTYSRGVGVNHAFNQHEPEDWTAVMDAADLQAGTPTKVGVGDATVLLYRGSDRIYGIGSRCSHAGGPLHEGKIDDGALCVQCPWHGSVFRLEDGSVVHGPASVPQAAYDVRTQDGRIEIRHRGLGSPRP
jgi:nitrite reductase/ring-hydroxylating ferredoxin subunit